MKKKLICYLLALGLLSSSMIVNASSLPDESMETEETVEGNSPEVIEPDVTTESNETAVESDEIQPESVEEQQKELQAEFGDGIEEIPREEELLGDQIRISGGKDQGSAAVISLNTEYVSQEQACWYKFTTKSEPAYYRLWMRNISTRSDSFRIDLKDDLKPLWSLEMWEGKEKEVVVGKLEPDHTYYISTGTAKAQDFCYLFSVTAYDDPEGDNPKEAYPLPLGETYRTSIAAVKANYQDKDYYVIQTAEAGHYRIKVDNVSLRSDNGFRIMSGSEVEIEKKVRIPMNNGTSDICLTLEGNTPYYIEVWCNDWGYDMEYNILAEYLTDHEGDTKETAYDLKVGEIYDTDLCARDDVDFYRLTPPISGKYVFDITNTSERGSKYYTICTERDEPLKTGYVDAGRKESPEVELAAGNTYYLSVRSWSQYDDDAGRYVVSYKKTSTVVPGNELPFTDINVGPGSWKYDSIKYVYDNKIMNGINGTTRFDPDEPLTRAMFATVLYRMAGSPEVQFRNIFEDVVDGRYYSRAVMWAYEQKIVQGMDGGKRYGIDEFITREQIAKMLREYGRVQGYAMNESTNLDAFPDRGDVSGWAVGYMKWAVGSGMVTGKNVGGTYYLDPKGNATRAECAAMLMRFLNRYKKI